jgi:hypothetical protein
MDDINNIVQMYFAHMQGRYFLEMLKSFAAGRGYGMESTCCIFSSQYSPEDEEYFGDSGVQISRIFPNEEYTILSHKEFYQYLEEESKNHIDKSSEINSYLNDIRKNLNID